MEDADARAARDRAACSIRLPRSKSPVAVPRQQLTAIAKAAEDNDQTAAESVVAKHIVHRGSRLAARRVPCESRPNRARSKSGCCLAWSAGESSDSTQIERRRDRVRDGVRRQDVFFNRLLNHYVCPPGQQHVETKGHCIPLLAPLFGKQVFNPPPREHLAITRTGFQRYGLPLHLS